MTGVMVCIHLAQEGGHWEVLTNTALNEDEWIN